MQSDDSKGDWWASALESRCWLRSQSSFETPPVTVYAITNDYTVAAPSYDILSMSPKDPVNIVTSPRRVCDLSGHTQDEEIGWRGSDPCAALVG